MMMMELAGGMGSGDINAGSPGSKGNKAFSMMRQRSSSVEDSVMTTFINNNNNNKIDVEESETFSREIEPFQRQEVGEEQKGEERMEQESINGGNNENIRGAGADQERRKNADEEDVKVLSPFGVESVGKDLSSNAKSHLQPESKEVEEEEEEEGMMVMDEEGFSSAGEMPVGDGDAESDKDEHRITVREALMSRAYQAAAAAKYGHGHHGHHHKYSSQSGRSSFGGSVPGDRTSPSFPMSSGGVNGHSPSRHYRDHSHSHQSSRGSSYSHQSLQRHSYLGTEAENFVKAERRSHPSNPSSPVNCDLKPDSLSGEGSVNGLGNALLSLASLGGLQGLAALQQSLPNFMSNPISHQGQLHQGHNAPLNLTHSNVRDIPYLSQGHRNSPPNGNPMSPNSLISSAIANITGGLGGAGGIPPPQGQGQTSIPQLILASGQISNQIQGAQLLIPTSQGIMSQTVLTIPITQPGSPSSMVPPNIPPNMQPSHHHLSSHPGSQGHKGRSHHHSQVSGSNLSHGPSRSLGHSQSPSISSGPPQRIRDNVSPDYTQDRARALLGLGSHLVAQSGGGGHMPTIPEKLTIDHQMGGINGVRNLLGKRDRESAGGTLGGSSLFPPKSSPCSGEDSMHDHDSDKFSDTEDDQMVDGINLDEIKEFAKAFKLRRLSLGLTQTQVGQALSITEGPAYSQSAICSALASWQLAQSQSYPPSHQQSMFEKLDITPKSAQKIKPVLERWMKEAEERYKNGHQNLNEFVGMEPSKKRKRRTSFTPQALEILNNHFERNTHPSGAEITTLAHQLGYEREVIRIWFCNKRQALKNTVRMMSK